MPAKTLLFIASSLDSYIADKDDNLDWLFSVQGDGDNGIHALYDQIDTILMGRRTYDWLIDHEPSWPYPTQTTYVFTRKKRVDTESIHFIYPENLVDFMSRLNQSKSKNTWLAGGGDLVKLFLTSDLVDQIILTLAPVLLGEGIPLFPRGHYASTWKLTKTEQFGEFMTLTYDKVDINR